VATAEDDTGWGSAATKSTLAQAVGEQFSLEKSIGGVRGVLESVVPLTVFSVLYGVTHDLKLSALSALAPAAAFSAWRLIRREPLTQALSGVFSVGLGAFVALRTGRSENYFLPTIIKNVIFAAIYALSIAVRWPLVGLVLGFTLGEMFHWREVPARMRVYQVATWLWVGLFGVRLLVQVPLYLMGRTAALGWLSVPLGIPLFALTAYLTWLVVRRVPVAHPPTPE
jgi:hypothetical protein